jgi:hypothetical protein
MAPPSRGPLKGLTPWGDEGSPHKWCCTSSSLPRVYSPLLGRTGREIREEEVAALTVSYLFPP